MVANGHADVMHLIANSFKLPNKVDPLIRRKQRRIAGNVLRLPAIDAIPDIPFADRLTASPEITLGPEDPAVVAEGLIYVKLQCLRPG